MNNRKWNIFYLKDFFSVSRGVRLIEQNRIAGNIPLVTAGFNNQGVATFIANSEMKKYKDKITIDMFCNAFYRGYEFFCDDNILVLHPKEKRITDKVCLFLVSMINKNSFGYGKQYRQKTFLQHFLMLPIDENKKPDWVYMEDFIERKTTSICNDIQLPKINVINDYRNFDEVKWKEFSVTDIFKISNGVRLESRKMIKGNIPFVGAIQDGNGVTSFISNKNSSLDKNVLGVNYNGNGMVLNFYHPYEAAFSDDVKRWHFKNIEGNKYLYLFVNSLIIKQKEKFRYGYKFNSNRMKRQKIMLPVKEDNKPDYDFMEQYMRRMENKVLAKSHLENF